MTSETNCLHTDWQQPRILLTFATSWAGMKQKEGESSLASLSKCLELELSRPWGRLVELSETGRNAPSSTTTPPLIISYLLCNFTSGSVALKQLGGGKATMCGHTNEKKI
ncbi:Hypothetical predicted protein [Podarcis lilfordi]|nr:Hypothetical predicted protein [Podarcis lilfordi]